MATPTSNQVHIDRALTNVSVAYQNTDYVADRIFPQVPVMFQSDKYFIYTKADWFRDEAAPRAPGTRAQRVDYTLSSGNYLCKEWGVAKGVPDEVVKNADTPLRPMVEATNYVTDKMYLRKEKLVADLAFGTGWSTSATPAILWSNDTSDPIGDVNAAVDNIVQGTGRKPNRGVIGRGLWRHLMKHPDLIDRIKGAASPGSPAILSQQTIAALFELDEIVIGNAVIDSAAEGATSSRGYVWGNHLLVAFVAATPSLMTPSAGYIFTWKNREVRSYIEDQEHQQVVEVIENFNEKIVAADAGYLIKSAA